MQKNILRAAVATAAAGLLALGLTSGAATAANQPERNSAPAPANSVTSSSVVNGSLYQLDINPAVVDVFRTPGANRVSSWNIRDNGVYLQDLHSSVRAKLDADDGDIVSVTAVSNLTKRPDSGLDGNWALDALTRTVSVTKQHAAEAEKCGGGATSCYFYTASLADNGSFTTVEGADSPGPDDVLINGTVTGTVTGGTKIEFYASSGEPNPALVPVNVEGAALTTGAWVNEFFADGTVVTASKLLNWKWTYSAPATCEEWVNGFDGNTGDITGVNTCG